MSMSVMALLWLGGAVLLHVENNTLGALFCVGIANLWLVGSCLARELKRAR